MTTLDEVRNGLATSLAAIPELRVTDHVPDDIAGYPAAVIFPPTNVDYSDDHGTGSFTVEIIVMLFVPASIARKQLDLYALMDRTGSSSVFAAVEADRTLGGLDVDARVVAAADPLDRAQMAGTQVFQRAVTVSVIVS